MMTLTPPSQSSTAADRRRKLRPYRDTWSAVIGAYTAPSTGVSLPGLLLIREHRPSAGNFGRTRRYHGATPDFAQK